MRRGLMLLFAGAACLILAMILTGILDMLDHHLFSGALMLLGAVVLYYFTWYEWDQLG